MTPQEVEFLQTIKKIYCCFEYPHQKTDNNLAKIYRSKRYKVYERGLSDITKTTYLYIPE